MTNKRGVPVLPDPNAAIEPWQFDQETLQVTPARTAEFWTPLRGNKVACNLCYRACVLAPGEKGWCGYRANENGRMVLGEHAHGVISSQVRGMRGYGPDVVRTYKPGLPYVQFGGTHCTSHCSFCMSKEIVWAPERVPWGEGIERRVGSLGWHYGHRMMVPPAAAVEVARDWQAQMIEFGINEPLLSWEWTYDVARLAQAVGIEIQIFTNGFSSEPAIDHLAEFVDSVDVGVKGHLDLTFYDKRMRAAGAPETVKASIVRWYEHGVHLTIGDLVPPPHWCSDAEAEQAARRFYSWLANEVDPHLPVVITPIHEPGPGRAPEIRPTGGYLLAKGAGPLERDQFTRRAHRALEIAREEGLAYAYVVNDDELRCHSCGGVLLRFRSPCLACDPCTIFTHFCHFWTHEQHAADGHCDHCGAVVPIVTLSHAELERIARVVDPLSRSAEATRHQVKVTAKGEQWLPLRPV